jgi:hypothetical protein
VHKKLCNDIKVKKILVSLCVLTKKGIKYTLLKDIHRHTTKIYIYIVFSLSPVLCLEMLLFINLLAIIFLNIIYSLFCLFLNYSLKTRFWPRQKNGIILIISAFCYTLLNHLKHVIL